MPCPAGSRPVMKVDQATGLWGGMVVASGTNPPEAARASKWGMRPAAISLVRISGSMPSIPSTSSGGASSCPRGPHPPAGRRAGPSARRAAPAPDHQLRRRNRRLPEEALSLHGRAAAAGDHLPRRRNRRLASEILALHGRTAPARDDELRRRDRTAHRESPLPAWKGRGGPGPPAAAAQPALTVDPSPGRAGRPRPAAASYDGATGGSPKRSSPCM